jgi:membrane-associated protein
VSPAQIAAAVAAVLIAAAAVWRRDRLSGERKLIVIGIVLALGVYASGILSELPDPKAIIEDIAQALGPWTYALVGVLAFLETGAFVGLVVPGETAIVVGGVVAERGEVELAPLIVLVWGAAMAGDLVSFFLGRRFGRPFLDRHGPRFRIRPRHVERVERFFANHGGKAVLVGRFVGLLRALNPFVAGASAFPLRRFLLYTALGTAGWATAFTLVGYGFSESFERSGDTATRVALAGALLAGALMILVARLRRGRGASPTTGGRGERAGYEAAEAPSRSW